ncbi:MAG: lysine 2,3-aminomutase [Elusimicrobiaceae bacterium]|nr:lysine 2,3-aminomutase [Elusimicrobiaceae bacterium]
MKKHPTVDYRKIPAFARVTAEQWNDWKWQLANNIKDIDTLGRIIELDDAEKHELEKCLRKFRMAITPYYAALMDAKDRFCPVRLQAVPRIAELDDNYSDLDDPLHEDVDSPVPGLTHRYPDRVLLLVTNICSMNCRHCTRRRLVGFEDGHMSSENIDRAIEYIRRTETVRDVLISGGDPLTLPDGKLEALLKKLRAIEHVEIIRIGSRVPVVMPMRITDELVNMLKKYHPLYVNTHFNHAKELTAEAREACRKLADAGIPLGNQSVLLKSVNDQPPIMKKLVHELLMSRVKPYYIYQCDLSKGISHFRTAVSKGIEIIESLRGHTTGMAVPTFVVDAPGGGGKIPVMPTYLISMSDRRAVLRNYEGVITTYTQPENIYSDETHCGEVCSDPRYKTADGVAGLLNGALLCLEPKDIKRRKRR